jgi:hypothetical protein
MVPFSLKNSAVFGTGSSGSEGVHPEKSPIINMMDKKNLFILFDCETKCSVKFDSFYFLSPLLNRFELSLNTTNPLSSS